MKNKDFDIQIKEMQNNLKINGKVFFYVRVSTKQQNEQLQLDAVEKFIKDNNISDPKIYLDKQTGTNANRAELQAMLKAIGKDDLLVVWKLDRLSRNYKECIDIWNNILDVGADIHVITMPILDTRLFPRNDLFGYLVNQLTVNIFAYFAQMETEMRSERASAGYKAMRTSKKYMTMPYKDSAGNLVESHAKKISSKTGRCVGREAATIPKNFESIVKMQENKEMTLQQALDALNMKKSTYYKLKSRNKEVK